MTIHKQGYRVILVVIITILTILALLYFFVECRIPLFVLSFLSAIILGITLQFFRNPNRKGIISEGSIISPADGKVVVIERTSENEYFKDERLKISIFMSLWNVHINFYPITGIIKYAKYHKGKYLLAINPKSSLENERTSIVIENKDKKDVLFRQIAGIVARRIVFYAKKDDKVKQSDECGFIKFGSRVDIFLPLDAKVKVKIGDKVKGSQSIIADL